MGILSGEKDSDEEYVCDSKTNGWFAAQDMTADQPRNATSWLRNDLGFYSHDIIPRSELRWTLTLPLARIQHIKRGGRLSTLPSVISDFLIQ